LATHISDCVLEKLATQKCQWEQTKTVTKPRKDLLKKMAKESSLNIIHKREFVKYQKERTIEKSRKYR
jgi:hypothetical protein